MEYILIGAVISFGCLSCGYIGYRKGTKAGMDKMLTIALNALLTSSMNKMVDDIVENDRLTPRVKKLVEKYNKK